MNIGLTAQKNKRVLLENFCIAYKGILKKHHLIATGNTGNMIEKTVGLSVEKLLAGSLGGTKQLQNMIMNNDIDIVIYFRSVNQESKNDDRDFEEVLNLCDKYNIPIASNIATAESLVLCLNRGDLEWRDYK